MLTSRSPRVVRARRDLPLDPESRMSADNKQEAEKVRRLRSCIVQTLNGDPAASPLGGAHRPGAPYSSHRALQRVRLRSSLAVALLNGPFEYTARVFH